MARDRKTVRTRDRGIERMERRADEHGKRTGEDAGISVERDDPVRVAQGLPVACDSEGRSLSAQELCQLRKRAAFAFKATVAFPVKRALSKKKIEAPAIFFIEGVDGLLRLGNKRRVAGHVFCLCPRQVGKQTEEQRLPRMAACKAQLLKAL